MADLISQIVDIISRLWPCCARHTRYLCKLQENKILLRNAIEELKEVRDDVQRRVVEAEADPNEPQKRTDPVRGWLQRVETIEVEVEEILQKVDEQLRRGRCIGGCCPPNNCWSNYKLGKSVVLKMSSLDELKGKGHFQEVTYRLPPPSVQDMNLESTVGMESMFDKVWRLITSTDDKVRIMGLYGHGGVGKTTLLKQINNEFKKISEHNHVVIFVVVSKPINVEAIQSKIGERLGLPLEGDESRRAEKVFNKLRNMNFVILLDDIWERVDLQRIGIPSTPQGNSSKVIFTTRNKEVCGLMEAKHAFQVECLPWDKAWSLFQDKVGREALISFPRALELAKDVAKQCGGLPLALITIGRAMSTKKSAEEWKDAITTLRNSASEFQGMSDEVLPRLKLSYDNLRNETIKSCFLYCALYPEDRYIEIAQLIDYWIGEGFLNGFDKLDEARSHGYHVIETLKRACLLESSEADEGTHVKMHDTIRDLALWIVNDCKSSSKMDKFLLASKNICARWENAERIFWMTCEDGSNNELENPLISPNLQTLIAQHYDYDSDRNFSLPQSFFQFTPFLRVLDMSFMKFAELPTSICELSDLQYLGLSMTDIKELPVELRKLVKLKFLDLSYTENLRKIPPGVIANLSDLQVLNLGYSGFKDWELKEEDGGLSFGELDRLKQLQDVKLTIYTSLALKKFLCNQKLRMICTTLSLTDCIHFKSVSLLSSSSSSTTTTILEGRFGNLISLKYLSISDSLELEELTLFINDDGETNTTTTTTTSAGLLSNNKLKSLHLHDLPRLNDIVWEKYYHTAAQQHYLDVSPFQNLYRIIIIRCNALKDLTWLVYVKNLKTLTVQECEGLKTIIELGDDGFEEAVGGDQMLNIGGGGGVFGRLETLDIYALPKLKSMCRHALAFPSIKTIRVHDCPELKKLPLESDSNINSTLKRIKGDTEWWNQLEWKDETIKSKFLPYYSEGW